MGETAAAVADPPAPDAAASSGDAPSSDAFFKQWLDLALFGPRTATGSVRKAMGMTNRMAHAPYHFGRGLVQSAVVVNVDVDVDIASRAPAA